MEVPEFGWGLGMAIRDKDGRVYKLRGPNPLMKEQEDWDKSKTKLINLTWGSEVVEDARNPVRELEENVINISKELGLKPNKEANKTQVIEPKRFIEELQESAVVEVSVEPEPIAETTINVDPGVARVLKEKGVVYYCAPVIGSKKHVDELYGTEYERMQYGDKFMFDAIVIAQSDLQIQFWCLRRLTKGSIVYRKIREGGERWWRLNEIEPKTGGYLVRAIPSDTNPDFS